MVYTAVLLDRGSCNWVSMVSRLYLVSRSNLTDESRWRGSDKSVPESKPLLEKIKKTGLRRNEQDEDDEANIPVL